VLGQLERALDREQDGLLVGGEEGDGRSASAADAALRFGASVPLAYTRAMRREGRLPSPFESGFHREDYMAHRPAPERVGWLSAAEAPRPGHNVKVQVAFDAELQISDARPEPATWALFGGTIVAVEDGGERLCVRATGTSDNVPEALDLEWEMRLARDDRYANPWQLESIAEVSSDVVLPPAYAKVSAAAKAIDLCVGVGGTLGLDLLDVLATRIPGGWCRAIAKGERSEPLVRTFDPSLGSIRGFRTTLHLFASPRGMPSEWRPHLSGVVLCGSGASSDGSLAGLDVPLVKPRDAQADAMDALKALAREMLGRLRSELG